MRPKRTSDAARRLRTRPAAVVKPGSLPPTEMQQRTIEAAVSEFADIVAKVNDVVANKMPALRAKMRQPPSPAVTPFGHRHDDGGA
jgi:hypothetical protein